MKENTIKYNFEPMNGTEDDLKLVNTIADSTIYIAQIKVTK